MVDRMPQDLVALNIPAGTPAWITPSLMRDTLETWQPYYDKTLTAADLVGILQSVGRLFDVMGEPTA
jgi:hypothetical protein